MNGPSEPIANPLARVKMTAWLNGNNSTLTYSVPCIPQVIVHTMRTALLKCNTGLEGISGACLALTRFVTPLSAI
jgi:hypothetical protein